MLPNKMQPAIHNTPQEQFAPSDYHLLTRFQQLLKKTNILTVTMMYTDAPHGHWPKIFFLKE
jgi:hypothetical protein